MISRYSLRTLLPWAVFPVFDYSSHFLLFYIVFLNETRAVIIGLRANIIEVAEFFPLLSCRIVKCLAFDVEYCSSIKTC